MYGKWDSIHMEAASIQLLTPAFRERTLHVPANTKMHRASSIPTFSQSIGVAEPTRTPGVENIAHTTNSLTGPRCVLTQFILRRGAGPKIRGGNPPARNSSPARSNLPTVC